MAFAGKIMEYEHESGDVHRLLFGVECITWECLSGSAEGFLRTVPYGAEEIESNLLFISWSDDDSDVGSIVADLGKNSLHCWHVSEGVRHFWKGTIKNFSDAPIKTKGTL